MAVKKKKAKKTKINTLHTWNICGRCANRLGGLIRNEVCTVTYGECNYCWAKKTTLIPIRDFTWPKEFW